MELSSVLPEYYDDNVTMQELQRILSEVTENLETVLKRTTNDTFWSKASGNEMLSRYEKMFGLSPDADKSDRYRRERIAARVSGSRNYYGIFDSAHRGKLYKNAAVELQENFSVYTVIARFVGTSGIPGIYRILKRVLKRRFLRTSRFYMSIYLTLMVRSELLRMLSL